MTTSRWARRSRAVAVGGLAALAATLLAATPAAATPADCDPSTLDGLLECVTVDGVRYHQKSLQDIADANGGNRASGSPGYDASAEYVAAAAADAGLTVTTQEFDFPYFEILGEALSAGGTEFVAGTDFTSMTFSGSGEVTGTAVPVDLLLPPTGGSTSGCEAEDFAGFPAGSVALLQRGTCDFGLKATNAAAAGAAAAIIVNEGNSPDRVELLQGTLGAPIDIPVVGATFALAEVLANTEVSLAVDVVNEVRTTTNVFAEKAGTTDSVLMVGAHLDSVAEGPGINDNGSGTAAILTVGKLMADVETDQTIRFAWWGAEELGLLGADYYVANLPRPELDRISAYLNFDMVGSPNFARFVYDGDDSDVQGAPAGPLGSEAVEDVFETFFVERGLTYEGTDFSGRSDYGPFIAEGVDIPSGGLFTGAEGIKTELQAQRYGGEAGVAFDPCYHQACDTYDNNSNEVLDQNADAIAYATYTLATTLELVPTGAPPGPAGDVGSGGGLHADHDHEELSS